MIIFTSLSYAQNSTQNWEDLEGTWKYQDEEIEFYLILVHKKIDMSEGNFENQLIGYSRLVNNGDIVYDNLYKIKDLSKDVYKILEVLTVKNPENSIDIWLKQGNNSIYGNLINKDRFSLIKIKCEYDNELLTLHFSKPHQEVIRPDIVQKREAMYANHIPELPSTWVLERVTEEEIEE